MATTLAAVTRVPAASLHVSKPVWWLKSRFHFSFADHVYADASRQRFGALRVLNDDIVAPGAGFGAHPHAHAEIFSYVLDGHLSHADSLGHAEALPRGCIQYMSAGHGVTHSEMNESRDAPCRFLQVWLTPDRHAPGYGAPHYGSTRYDKADRQNRLLHVLGGTTAPPSWPDAAGGALQHPAGASAGMPHPAVRLHADANVYVSESDSGKMFRLPLAPARQAYVVCAEGGMTVNGQQLDARDAAEVRGTQSDGSILELTAGPSGAHFLLIELSLSLSQG